MQNKGTILVIDDEIDLLEMIQFQLEVEGFEVVIAENGVEGLERLKTCNPDLIILDLNMPLMGGMEFYEVLAGEKNSAKYPIIALTAQERIDNLFEGFNIEAYMAKPFQIEKLINTVKITMKKKY